MAGERWVLAELLIGGGGVGGEQGGPVGAVAEGCGLGFAWSEVRIYWLS